VVSSQKMKTTPRFAICVNKKCRRTYQYQYGYKGSDPDAEMSLLEEPPRHCRRCGRPMLHNCPNCGRELDRKPTKREPYCEGCGTDLLSVEFVAKEPIIEPPQLQQ